MNDFAQPDALRVWADLVTAIPGAIGPALMALAVCLSLFVFADRIVDARSDARASR